MNHNSNKTRDIESGADVIPTNESKSSRKTITIILLVCLVLALCCGWILYGVELNKKSSNVHKSEPSSELSSKPTESSSEFSSKSTQTSSQTTAQTTPQKTSQKTSQTTGNNCGEMSGIARIPISKDDNDDYVPIQCFNCVTTNQRKDFNAYKPNENSRTTKTDAIDFHNLFHSTMEPKVWGLYMGDAHMQARQRLALSYFEEAQCKSVLEIGGYLSPIAFFMTQTSSIERYIDVDPIRQKSTTADLYLFGNDNHVRLDSIKATIEEYYDNYGKDHPSDNDCTAIFGFWDDYKRLIETMQSSRISIIELNSYIQNQDAWKRFKPQLESTHSKVIDIMIDMQKTKSVGPPKRRFMVWVKKDTDSDTQLIKQLWESKENLKF